MADNSIFLIDIDKVLQTKLPSKYKYIPRFFVSYLKRIVHQEELNEFLRSAKNKIGVDFLKASMNFLDNKIEVRGMENLPENRPATFVCNHPLGGQDGVSVGMILGEHYHGKVKYIVNDLLMNLHNLAPLCIPVNKTGHQSRHLPEIIEKGFQSTDNLIIFPAGICSRRHHGEITDREWGKAFIVKSVETQRDVVPMYFEGRNSNFFYNLSSIRKFLGIKFNIEMLYLANEMFKNRHKTFTLTIGKPIPWQTFSPQQQPLEWSVYVRNIVYKLK